MTTCNNQRTTQVIFLGYFVNCTPTSVHFRIFSKEMGDFLVLSPTTMMHFVGSPKVSFVQEFALCKQLEQSLPLTLK